MIPIRWVAGTGEQMSVRPFYIVERFSAPNSGPSSCHRFIRCGRQSARHRAWARKLRFVIQLNLFVDKGDTVVNSENPKFNGKAQIDALLLELPSVSARKINGLDAYFVNDRMFACISGSGVGLRLPAATATELQFSRDDVVPFQPGGMPSSREWIQIDHAHPADYEKDLQLFLASLEFVKTARTR
jgi:hypothetical protein